MRPEFEIAGHDNIAHRPYSKPNDEKGIPYEFATNLFIPCANDRAATMGIGSSIRMTQVDWD